MENNILSKMSPEEIEIEKQKHFELSNSDSENYYSSLKHLGLSILYQLELNNRKGCNCK